jgi:site-specific DNA-methyltransferase (cytosine-N4-specific)
LLQIPNTESNSRYIQLCKASGARVHPARFPQKLPAFFIDFLTEPDDLVLDIFAGSNTAGAAAEAARRRWLAFELDRSYLSASAFRFVNGVSAEEAKQLYESLLATDKRIDLEYLGQLELKL